MALSNNEKQRIVEMLDKLDRGRSEAILRSENSFLSWLKGAARWLWDKVAGSLVGQIISVLWHALFG